MWRVAADVHFSRSREYKSRMNPLETLSEEDFYDRYRFPKHVVIDLCDDLRRPLERISHRGQSLSVELQVCTALRYYCQGGFLPVLGDLHGVSERAAGNALHSVSEEICRINDRYINWKDENYLMRQMESFYRYCGMPKTIGCIDGCHIPILGPVINEKVYVNRKGHHSINCQVVCDSSLRIYDLSPKWPGSSHDAFILKNSNIWDRFNQQETFGWLLGDSAYPLLPWLMTPVANAATRQENRYNAAHKKGRSTVERCNGLFKARFRCLTKPMMFSPQKCSRIILACGVLHNVAIERQIHMDFTEDVVDVNNEDNYEANDNASAAQARARLIRSVFA